MPNIKSAKKRVKVNNTKARQNQMRKSAIKTYIKNFEAFVEAKDVESAKSALNTVNKKLDQAVSKNTLKLNIVSRKKSQLSKKLNSITA